jgi:3-hydroxyisobutyrate dehydrogenase-like beta-hydroxyacid dehydrogenase
MKIGFLGYGEAARAFHDGLAGLTVLAYDLRRDTPMRAAMSGRGAVALDGVEGLAGADWIFSAVTADQSLRAVEPLLPHLRPGHVVIDINSVSPGRKRDTAAAVTASGAEYLDMAVMAPVHPLKLATPVLLAGSCAARMLPDLTALGFSAALAGDEPGAATAVKMVRSLFVKGLEAIAVETLLAARASGCYDAILASLSASYPGLNWPGFAAYQFERTTRHGTRRAAEMRESAATVAALGLCGDLAEAIAEVQARMGACGAGPEAPLVETIDRVMSLRRAS